MTTKEEREAMKRRIHARFAEALGHQETQPSEVTYWEATEADCQAAQRLIDAHRPAQPERESRCRLA